MNEYAGESLAKKVARVRLYRRARAAMRYSGINPKRAFAVFLPGPDASEVGALKHMLGLAPCHVIAVDRDQTSCERAEERWPDVYSVNGDLADPDVFAEVATYMELEGGDGLSLLHLDLMGNLSHEATLNYAVWQQLVGVGGVMAMTYLRGRETPSSFGAKMKKSSQAFEFDGDRSSEAKGLNRIMSADRDRAWSHFAAVQHFAIAAELKRRGVSVEEMLMMDPEDMCHGATAGPLFTPLATYSYRAETSPMGVLAMHRVERSVLESESYATLRYANGRDTSSIIRKDPMDLVLAEADSLLREFSRQQVAEILDVSPRTLAAWRAHRTMGSYA